MKKILIVVDMQEDFIRGPLGNEDCRNAVQGCVDLCENGGFDGILFTRDTHYADYLSTLEGQKLPVKHCIVGSKGWQIIPELKEISLSKNAYIVDKPTFGSLPGISNNCTVVNVIQYFQKETPLPEPEKVELHFAGVCTSICVLSNMTICRAAFPNMRIVLHRNATGDVTEEMKQAAFVCAKAIQCDVED